MAEELRKITQEELDNILVEHQLWFESDGKKGKRANLLKADLYKANLFRANLMEADLRGTNLQEADLSKANLGRANLFNANLGRANLQEADLQKTDLSLANLQETNLQEVYLFRAYLQEANLLGANLLGANLLGANLLGANLLGANLEDALYLDSQLEKAINVPSKYLLKKDIILDTESQIKSLQDEKKELQEKLQQASSATKEEKERLKQVEAQLELAEQTIQREQDAKKKTKAQIETAVKYLKNPNAYISKQITFQYILMGLYVLLSLLTVWFFMNYINDHYTNFKLNMDSGTTFINWLFYASPLLISFSLIITFINQINKRLQNIVRLNERKRYVDSVEGGLQAINALSINNEDARKKILDTMEKIINHTLQSSEKANEPIMLEEKAVEDPLATLSKIKDLVK
ncbi:hypothetical protein GCM10011344_18120 [Dokdonia pacifica]|uniref:Pentapeptide repeat-containing protein n=1 Tax=Dokdonia pacifica TaxID=1627892 RepID=A0A238VSZ9_9FLAO|nr:pentapeptide repeat-containing protein [Dokdonia pacifica]GGG17882.1 hypothetical protein GCM10011344_18120 [Dokdonia pacifica]SNR37470.1 Pentapeptide repeat-containing protein [Dokdonia pacifica]